MGPGHRPARDWSFPSRHCCRRSPTSGHHFRPPTAQIEPRGCSKTHALHVLARSHCFHGRWVRHQRVPASQRSAARGFDRTGAGRRRLSRAGGAAAPPRGTVGGKARAGKQARDDQAASRCTTKLQPLRVVTDAVEPLGSYCIFMSGPRRAAPTQLEIAGPAMRRRWRWSRRSSASATVAPPARLVAGL